MVRIDCSCFPAAVFKDLCIISDRQPPLQGILQSRRERPGLQAIQAWKRDTQLLLVKDVCFRSLGSGKLKDSKY